MNRSNGPLSPASSGSNDSSFVPQSRYQNSIGGGAFMGAPSDVPYSGGPYGAARPMQSPPSSGYPSSSTDASRPSASSAGRPPSSASSVGARSDARGMGMGMAANHRDSTRSTFRPEHEDVLQKHYYSLRTYLASHLRDEKGNMKPNRARDKLLRLSVTQFMELSTDVYDELIRREDDRTHRVQNVPRFLPPKQNFHPKRNQARQKLSTLPVERFRQLATDVFFELERRVPRFTGGDVDRPMSGGPRAQSRSGMRPPPGWRGPPPPGRPIAGPGSAMHPGFRANSPGPNAFPGQRSRNPSDASSLGRPLPKNFNGGTVVPNKSTMVEDDDDDEEEDGLSGRLSEIERDKETIRSLETEVDELKKQVETLEAQLQEKDQEIQAVRDSGEERERSEWTELRGELEQKVTDVQQLNDDMHNELEMLKRNKHMDEQNMKDEILALQQQLSEGHGGNAETLEAIQAELDAQQKLMAEVRKESLANLQEMRELSHQNDAAVAQEERLAAQVSTLEHEIDEWRERYARMKSQNKALRASTMGLNLQTNLDSGGMLRKEGLISHDGLVRDVDVTRFQLAIDDLLKIARLTDTEALIESVKQVTIGVQAITSNIGTDGYPTPSPSPHSPSSANDHSVARLKARVTGTANSLITATKQHATAFGLSPVALLDAAASNLTAAVVELVKSVGIKPTSGVEAEADMESFYGERDSDYAPIETAVAVQQGSAAKKAPAVGWFNWGRRSQDSPDDGEHDYDVYS